MREAQYFRNEWTNRMIKRNSKGEKFHESEKNQAKACPVLKDSTLANNQFVSAIAVDA